VRSLARVEMHPGPAEPADQVGWEDLPLRRALADVLLSALRRTAERSGDRQERDRAQGGLRQFANQLAKPLGREAGDQTSLLGVRRQCVNPSLPRVAINLTDMWEIWEESAQPCVAPALVRSAARNLGGKSNEQNALDIRRL
jgi:hypothetical protein